MGLDMYLTKRHHVQHWDHNPPEQQYTVIVLRGGQPTNIRPERITHVIEQVAYWRRANRIHCWFVKNVQKGKDDCGDYYVDFTQLQRLLETIDIVLNTPSCGEILFPDTFGDTKFNERSLDGLRHAKEMLSAILAEPDADKTDYYYSSSW